MIKTESHKIEVEPGIVISSIWAFPAGYSVNKFSTFILAHGAGSDMHAPFLCYVQEALARVGFLTVRFNFPYAEEGRKAPDRASRLLRTWHAVIDRVRNQARPPKLFVGGRSMGGRIASMVAAEGEDVTGLVLFAYPLHPAGRAGVLRREHLAHIACPILFVQGSRDPLCDLDLVREVIASLSAPVTLQVIDEGDHSFKVPKRLGTSERAIWDSVVERVVSWSTRVP